jgi:glyoxylase-like metal-dependent hydrolase (beta-lactamase superfamily II)
MNQEIKANTTLMPIAKFEPDVDWIKCAKFTSNLVISKTKEAILIDCGSDKLIKNLLKIFNPKFALFNSLRKRFEVNSVQMCWITHYHDDHVDGLTAFQEIIKAPLFLEEHIAEIQKHPIRYFIPCISPVVVKHPEIIRDEQTWEWNEFKFTAYFFPGQTLYHSGLFIESPYGNAFFAGDSFSPTGMDDYCAPNRLFFRADSGYFRCLDILEKLKPERIYNSHIPHGFHFTEHHFQFMRQALVKRLELFRALLPHKDPNIGIDPYWVQCYPYEQDIKDEKEVDFGVEITNHTESEAVIEVEPVLPNNWSLTTSESELKATIAPLTAGILLKSIPNPDGFVHINVTFLSPPDKGKYIIPVRIKFNNQYWGQICHTIINIQ